MKLKIFFFFFFLLITTFNYTKAQVVSEHHDNDIYQYLSRMAAKGLIKFDDQIRPLSRIYIGACLDSLAAKQEQLTKIERTEMLFYQRDFSDEKAISITQEKATGSFFGKDNWNRIRGLNIVGKDFLMRVDPILNGGVIAGSGRSIKFYGSGVRFYGYSGKHWAWHFSFNDITEEGKGVDTLRNSSGVTGAVGRIGANKKSFNYSEFRGGISYSWKNGSIGFGQDYLLTGYGENGRIILSEKAPSFPQIRLDYQPLPWLKFNYTHAWLQSNIIDSNRSFNTGVGTYGGRRDVYIPKFLAIHSLQFTPVKGLDIQIGESMVYSDRLNVGYLLPIMFFKINDLLASNENINAGSNGQLFLQVSSRNHLRKSHIYGSLFIDEIRFGSIFNKQKSRNQLGYTLGMNVTDIALPYLTLGMEYTRINPFVYRNLQPAQNYTNHDFVMGDWMGNNSDRMLLFARYTPLPRLRLMLRYEHIRKGGPGTLDQQYFQQPQPSFLFDPQYRRNNLYGEAVYHCMPGFQVFANFTHSRTTNQQNNTSTTDKWMMVGFRLGR